MTSHTHVCTQPDTDTDIATDTFKDILRHKHTQTIAHTDTNTHPQSDGYDTCVLHLSQAYGFVES